MTSFTGENLSCIRSERLVFSDLSFALSAGDLLLLCGPNGSGKTSALRIMAGLTPPASGSIHRDGTPLNLAAHRSDLGYAGHHDAVKPGLTVHEDLTFWHGLRGGMPDALATAMTAMGLEALAEMQAGLLSAGQRRRLALARLACGTASLWLLDEPETALDREGQERFSALLLQHRAAGGIAVVATHAAPKHPDPDTALLDITRLGTTGYPDATGHAAPAAPSALSRPGLPS